MKEISSLAQLTLVAGGHSTPGFNITNELTATIWACEVIAAAGCGALFANAVSAYGVYASIAAGVVGAGIGLTVVGPAAMIGGIYLIEMIDLVVDGT